MKIIRNKVIPFKGFKAINLFGVLFVRKEAVLSEADINHEAIHTAQMKEMLYVGFYLWYAVEWLVRLIRFRDTHSAYRNVSFEREAYANQADLEYLQQRKQWSWTSYL